MFLGRDGFVWWIGVVEDIEDPSLLGRAKVRIFGYHPKYVNQSTTTGDENNLVPTADLPWATVVMTPNLPNFYGRLRLGEWVLGFFLDGVEAQEPAILGYIPGGPAGGENFGKHAITTKTFDHVHPLEQNQYTFQTPEGQYLKFAEPTYGKETTLYNSTNFYLRLVDIFGFKYFNVIHPSGAFIQIQGDGKTYISTGDSVYGASQKLSTGNKDIIVSGPGGEYSLTYELQRIINHIYPPPPPPPRRRGGCFTGETLVTMWDDSKKRIDEIQVGDLIKTGIHTQSGKVLFIEKLKDTMMWKELYSPSTTVEPFATPNHPLFVNGEWVALHTNLYDWMPKTNNVKDPIVCSTKGDYVYNLWIQGGDGTYFVNNFLTHSILYDGGFMRLAWEKEYLTHEEVMGLMFEFTVDGGKLTYGSYLINKMIGVIDQKHWIKLISYIMKREKEYLPRKGIIALMKISATVMRLINRRK